MDLGWSDFQPAYEDLASRRPLRGDAEDFLRDWTGLAEAVDETYSRLYVATTLNTADMTAQERFHRFLDDVYPKAEQAEQQLRTILLAHGSAPAGFELPMKRMKTDAEIYREENLPLKTEEQKLGLEYDKIMGAQTVQWEGKEFTIAQLRPFFQDRNRERREAVWRLASARQTADGEAIGDLWRRFLSLRCKIAENAGFPDFRSFRWREFHRFDYTPEDCLAFHRAIEEAVVPAAAALAEERRLRLGVDSLRPWDMEVDPLGRDPLVPFQSAEKLERGAEAIFHRVDPSLGRYFSLMRTEGLLDLANRKDKAPGGYCTQFAASRRPFIFMNAVGVHDDVQTLLHEGGHAFHAFEAFALPYHQQRQVGMEFAEVASMSMELLASPYLSSDFGGFYTAEDARRALQEHLERNIRFWPYMAVVDAFQHWVYLHPEDALDTEKCDEAWTRTWKRFITWIDWTGLEQELADGWRTKLHIHTVPFYYVEYGLAQLGAVQVWGNFLKDRKASVDAYRRALALGGSVSLPDLFSAAGAKFRFDAQILRDAVALMREAHANGLSPERGTNRPPS
jgi:oligoendopeptidase F